MNIVTKERKSRWNIGECTVCESCLYDNAYFYSCLSTCVSCLARTTVSVWQGTEFLVLYLHATRVLLHNDLLTQTQQRLKYQQPDGIPHIYGQIRSERPYRKKESYILLHGHVSSLKSTQWLSRVAGGGSYRQAFLLRMDSVLFLLVHKKKIHWEVLSEPTKQWNVAY
jgi:hypothetical protein